MPGTLKPCLKTAELSSTLPVSQTVSDFQHARAARQETRHGMDGDIIGLVAVIMIFGIPIAGMYTYYRVRKLRTEERVAALARGLSVPMEPELSQAARSRRAGILLVSASIGYTVAFALIARAEPDAWIAAAFGVIPFAVGLGFFLDSTLRSEEHTSELQSLRHLVC